MTDAHALAEGLQRNASGDQSPPKPWAYLSGLGITQVSDLAFLQVAGFTDQAGFDVVTRDGRFRVMVSRVAD